MTELHPTIRDIPMPGRIAVLPLTENGFPVLFFADEFEGKPDLRVMDPRKLIRCIKEKLCWLCGRHLGSHIAFVLGPMCCVTRTTSEPPSHLDCASYAVKACPFLTRPRAHRRETGLPDELQAAGIPIARNPGAIAIWVCRDYKTWRPEGGGILITVGEPNAVSWWAEGRKATYTEVVESIESGAHLLFEQCEKDSDPEDSRGALTKQFAKVLPWLRGLPGREAHKPEQKGMNEAVMIAARGDEIAWFAAHPAETEYIRPARPGEYPPDIAPKPTHVRITKLDETGQKRQRTFGVAAGGVFTAAG